MTSMNNDDKNMTGEQYRSHFVEFSNSLLKIFSENDSIAKISTKRIFSGPDKFLEFMPIENYVNAKTSISLNRKLVPIELNLEFVDNDPDDEKAMFFFGFFAGKGLPNLDLYCVSMNGDEWISTRTAKSDHDKNLIARFLLGANKVISKAQAVAPNTIQPVQVRDFLIGES